MTRTLSKSWPQYLGIRSPFTIPSGIVTTNPSVIARIARYIPDIGFLTTKTLSVAPREGYREPILHEYHPGCFVNAVGLANPGARAFLEAMKPLLPLHDKKPLIVSIMGNDPAEFLECALTLDPIADAFELNLSCPHVKGAGQCVGSDPQSVRRIISLLKQRLSKPIIPKLSPNLGDIPGMAKLCEEAGADGLALINTVGPGVAVDAEANPILSNVTGGLSGAGILPIGLKAVREAADAVSLPIIASGGIGSADDVRAYAKAGATFFAVGSALAGMTTPQLKDFFNNLASTLGSEPKTGTQGGRRISTEGSTSYFKTRVVEKVFIAPDFFRLSLEDGPQCRPGQFFFLRLPGTGEKPFSPLQDLPPVYLVRTVGPFTRALEALEPGQDIYLRGPYGCGFPEPKAAQSIVLVGGGTGVAPVAMSAARWSKSVARAFFGFSFNLPSDYHGELEAAVLDTRIVVDPPDRPGEVTRALAEDLDRDPALYEYVNVYLCGPSAMMATAVQVLSGRVPRERIFMAREDIMRCGIGVCGSCGTETGLRSCVDGPVMNP